jgi:4-amino-4-deoxy-L-arabinose transferase-like glycosyltransferase
MTGLAERRDARVSYAPTLQRQELGEHPAAAESKVAAVFLLAALLLRLMYVFHYRIDSDEPQHLHVVWSWAHGLLQYRDVFDNHAPLFHLLCAPFFAMADERADILTRARLAMLPFYAVAVGCTYEIAAALFSRRAALWAAVLTALFSGFFLTSLEFRADDLWTVLWLLGLALLVRAPVTRGRSLGVGVLFGAALGVSLKTVLLLVSVALAVLAIPILVEPRARAAASRRRLAGHVLPFLAGFTVVPAFLVTYFAWRGALEAFYYGTIAHNALPGLGLWHSTPSRIFLLPVAAPLLWIAARRVARAAPTPPIARRRLLVFLTTGIFLTLLLGVWPLVTREDFLPIDPLVVLLVTGLLLPQRPAFLAAGRRLQSALHFGLPIMMAVGEVVFLLHSAPPWQDDARKHIDLVDAVLRLTTPTDYVMDAKGETIFRRRPFFYVLERISRTRIQRGLIVDDIAERLVATHTVVVASDQPAFPPFGRAFMNEHYLSVGALRVLGQFLTSAPTMSASSAPARAMPDQLRFDVVIPARYAIAAEDGRANGLLDGSPYEGPRALEAGAHEFVSSNSSTPLALIWAPALERGFSPFGLDRGH